MIEAGDMLPLTALADAHGQAVSLADQRIAGAPFILVLGGAAVPQTVLHTIRIVDGPPGADAAAPGSLVLVDTGRALAAALGIEGPTLIAVGSDLRVRGIFAPDIWTEAVSALTEDALAPPFAPVLVVPGVAEPMLAERLIACWETGRQTAGGVASSGEGKANMQRADMKRRTDVMIEDAVLFDAVKTRIARRLAPLMYRAFGFRLASMEALRIGCYEAADGGFFARHRDNATPFTAARRFAMSLNLNTGDYEGGGIVFPEFGRQVYAPPAGGAVVFSCSLLHEALPVTAGRRFGVFTFFTDAEGLKAQEAIRAKSGKGVRLT